MIPTPALVTSTVAVSPMWSWKPSKVTKSRSGNTTMLLGKSGGAAVALPTSRAMTPATSAPAMTSEIFRVVGPPDLGRRCRCVGVTATCAVSMIIPLIAGRWACPVCPDVTARFVNGAVHGKPEGGISRAPAKSGLDFLTCGDAAQHAGDGRLLGRHGPGDDHEGSSRHLLITKDHARCHHRPRTPSLTSSTRTSCPTYQKHRRRYWPR